MVNLEAKHYSKLSVRILLFPGLPWLSAPRPLKMDELWQQ